MKTAMQELLKHFDEEVNLGFCSKEYAERAKWHISTYFIPKERQQIEDAYNDGAARNDPNYTATPDEAPEYFTDKYEQ